MEIKKTILFVAFALASPCYANGDDITELKQSLAIAKMTGFCGTITQMLIFQESTQIAGGDEFISRFVNTEAARLGTDFQELLNSCKEVIEKYERTQQTLNEMK